MSPITEYSDYLKTGTSQKKNVQTSMLHGIVMHYTYTQNLNIPVKNSYIDK